MPLWSVWTSHALSTCACCCVHAFGANPKHEPIQIDINVDRAAGWPRVRGIPRARSARARACKLAGQAYPRGRAWGGCRHITPPHSTQHHTTPHHTTPHHTMATPHHVHTTPHHIVPGRAASLTPLRRLVAGRARCTGVESTYASSAGIRWLSRKAGGACARRVVWPVRIRFCARRQKRSLSR